MRILRFVLALLLLAGASACGDPATFRLDGPLSVRVRAPRVELRNETPRPVYVFVVERESAARIDWMTCVNPDECDAIAPGDGETVRYDQIAGYEDGDREAIVYWWHVVQQPGGGWAAETVHSQVVRL